MSAKNRVNRNEARRKTDGNRVASPKTIIYIDDINRACDRFFRSRKMKVGFEQYPKRKLAIKG